MLLGPAWLIPRKKAQANELGEEKGRISPRLKKINSGKNYAVEDESNGTSTPTLSPRKPKYALCCSYFGFILLAFSFCWTYFF
jgi:hypothetical protein